MEAIATFILRDREINPIRIQCRADEKLGKIIERFANKENVNLSDYDYFYNGISLNKDSTIIFLKGKNARNIDISVKRKLKIMKCPECICNNAIIKSEDYKLKFSGCRYNHKKTEIFSNYERTQKIDYEQIECHINECKKKQSESLKDFYKCMDCSGPEINNKTTYFCSTCNQAHVKNEKHKTIKYDEKYYYCPDHFFKFISYCKNCKSNLCTECEKEHNKIHEIKKFDSVNFDLQQIKNDLEEIKQKQET